MGDSDHGTHGQAGSSSCSNQWAVPKTTEVARALGSGREGRTGIRVPKEPLLAGPQEIPLRSNVYEVYATDKDEGLNGAVRYSFLKTAGNRDWEYFTIDAISGLIQTAQRLDRETQAVYSVRGGAQGMWAVPGRVESIKMRSRAGQGQGHVS